MALGNKKTPRKFIKGRTGGLFSSDRISKASASMASDDIGSDIGILEGPISPVLYQMDLMQEDIDEIRRHITNDRTQTDNNFTDANQTKLDGIEASADVTDSTNVQAAGALMDSEVTSLDLVKGLTSSQISGSFNDASASLSTRVTTIEDAGYTTNTGTVTNVTVGTGLDISNGSTTPSITLDLSEFTDMTSAINSSQDELILLDNGAERRKLISEIPLSSFDGTLPDNLSFSNVGGSQGAKGEISPNTGTSLTAGDVYYMNSSGTWTQTDADAESSSTGHLGIAISSTKVMIRGYITLSAYSSFTTGGIMYLSTTLGDMTQTAPSGTGDVQRIVGYYIGNSTVYFNPSNDYIVRS